MGPLAGSQALHTETHYDHNWAVSHLVKPPIVETASQMDGAVEGSGLQG